MKYTFLLLFFLIFTVSVAQQTDNRFVVTEKVNQLLNDRADCFSKAKTTFKYYHIQLYNGQNINKAREIKSKFFSFFPDDFAIVEWESPEFKVWVGEYENKLSADQALLKIKKEFPNAFVVNPKK